MVHLYGGTHTSGFAAQHASAIVHVSFVVHRNKGCSRFLLNLPNEVKQECSRNFVRMFFELERAHWFYLDHYIEDPTVGGVDLFGFAKQSNSFNYPFGAFFAVFTTFPEVVPKGLNWQEKYLEWRKYRGETETGSAIIIDEYFEMVLIKFHNSHYCVSIQILLVQGFYGNRWSFPGGKVNENECLTDCAVREVSRFILAFISL